MSLMQKIYAAVPDGATIRKPRSESVAHWRKDPDGEKTLFYFLPGGAPKYIPPAAFIEANRLLCETGEFVRTIFNRNDEFKKMAGHSPCNFTVIGGVFVHLGEAEYVERGVYRKKVN